MNNKNRKWYEKEMCKKLKKGYVFPWVSEYEFCPIPLCKPGDCLICRFCSDVFLDWHGPYGVVCCFGRHEGNCKSFMLDKDQPLFHPEDRKNIDAYIAHIRHYNDSNKDSQGDVCNQNISAEELFKNIQKAMVQHQDLFKDESILKYLDNLFGDDKDIEQDHCRNESSIIDIDEFTTEEEINNEQ